MATLREVRSRISSVKQTQKITKAMKMVAAAKLRRAQSAVVAARPYARGMRGLLQHLLPTVEPGSEPLLTARPLRRLGVIVVTSDRGLCGAFNANIIRATTAHLSGVLPGSAGEGTVRLFCVGKKGLDYFVKQALPVPGKYAGLFSHLTVAAAQNVVRQVVEMYLAGELDRVDVVYNEFKSIAQQRLVVEQILPVVPDASRMISEDIRIHELIPRPWFLHPVPRPRVPRGFPGNRIAPDRPAPLHRGFPASISPCSFSSSWPPSSLARRRRSGSRR